MLVPVGIPRRYRGMTIQTLQTHQLVSLLPLLSGAVSCLWTVKCSFILSSSAFPACPFQTQRAYCCPALFTSNALGIYWRNPQTPTSSFPGVINTLGVYNIIKTASETWGFCLPKPFLVKSYMRAGKVTWEPGYSLLGRLLASITKLGLIPITTYNRHTKLLWFFQWYFSGSFKTGFLHLIPAVLELAL